MTGPTDEDWDKVDAVLGALMDDLESMADKERNNEKYLVSLEKSSDVETVNVGGFAGIAKGHRVKSIITKFTIETQDAKWTIEREEPP